MFVVVLFGDVDLLGWFLVIFVNEEDYLVIDDVMFLGIDGEV